MRGTRAFRHNRRGLGGFTEAVMTLMVVTLAVILLSVAFSLTSLEVLRDNDKTSLSVRCIEVWRCMIDDEMLWNGDAIVLSSFDSRALDPYAHPEGIFGYDIYLIDVDQDNRSFTRMFNGFEVEGAEVFVDEHPVLVMNELGELHAGLIEIRVW